MWRLVFYVRRDSRVGERMRLVCGSASAIACSIRSCDMAYSYMWHDCVEWRANAAAARDSHVNCNAFICVTWLIVWHNSCIGLSWLVAGMHILLQHPATHYASRICVCRVLQGVVGCCRVQCVAVHCNASRCSMPLPMPASSGGGYMQQTVTYLASAHSNIWHAAFICASYANAAATHCNTLQHAATHTQRDALQLCDRCCSRSCLRETRLL